MTQILTITQLIGTAPKIADGLEMGFFNLEDLRFYGVAGCAKGESVYQTAEDFRVLPEKWLSEPRMNWNEEIKSYVPDFITNRQLILINYFCKLRKILIIFFKKSI